MLKQLKRISLHISWRISDIRATIRDNRLTTQIIKSKYEMLSWTEVRVIMSLATLSFAMNKAHGHKARARACERLIRAAYCNGLSLMWPDDNGDFHPDYEERKEILNKLWRNFIDIKEGKAV